MSQAYLVFPQIDPVIFSLGPLSIRWYGLMYLIAFLMANFLANRAADKPNSGWTDCRLKILSILVTVLGCRTG